MTTRRSMPHEVATQEIAAERSEPNGRAALRQAVKPASVGSSIPLEARVDHGTGSRARPSLTEQRGERSRRRIAEALIELLGESDPPPSSLDVASRAGVSLRLIFHHFGDVDAVYEKALDFQASQYWAAIVPVAPNLPLDRRIDQTVRQRAKLFEAIGPLWRAAAPLAVRSPKLARAIAEGDVRARLWLEITFAPELRRADRQRCDLLGSIEMVTSWEAWSRLRRVQGLGVTAASRVMRRSLAGVVGDVGEED